MLLGLQGEGVGVDAGVGRAGVVVERLHGVEVLAGLLLEAVLAVEHNLEQVQRTHLDGGRVAAILDPVAVACGGGVQNTSRAGARQVDQVGHTARVGQDPVVGNQHGTAVARDVHVGRVGREVPHGVQVGAGRSQRRADRHGGVGVAPDQLLHGVVEGQADQLHSRLGGGASGHGVTAGVLHLLDQVLVTLLGEAATLLRVQVHVVGPHLERCGGVEVQTVVAGQVEVQAHLVVLQSNQRQVQAGVAVEEEEQRQVHAVLGAAAAGQVTGVAGHLAVGKLVRLAQVQLGVQAPPGLVVLVDALATDGQLDLTHGTLSEPVGVVANVVGRQVRRQGGQRHVHVADQVAVAGNRDGHTAAAGGATVGRLLDQLHREVRVALVHRLEEGHLGVSSKIHILSTVSYELHKSARHGSLVLLTKKKISAADSASEGHKVFMSR